MPKFIDAILIYNCKIVENIYMSTLRLVVERNSSVLV